MAVKVELELEHGAVAGGGVVVVRGDDHGCLVGNNNKKRMSVLSTHTSDEVYCGVQMKHTIEVCETT